MDPLSVYIPMDRRQALHHGQNLPDRVQGAVLFADISGFTPLTYALFEDLGAQRGAEALTRHLNHVFDGLIAAVHRFGGSVISLHGDALTCWFDGDDGSRTTTCAIAMQEQLAARQDIRTPSGACFTVAMKVAVAAGSARRFLVGRPRVQLVDVLAGSLLDRVAAAEQQLQPGEVGIGAEVMGRLGNRVQIREWRAVAGGEHFALVSRLVEPTPPQPWPAMPHLPTAVARGWLLPAIYQRLQRGEASFLAELRTAVPLFVQFGGIQYDADDAAGHKLNAYVCWVQSVLTHYGGTLLELSMGDKGGYFYAIVGAPAAHEDNAARAVAAALELRTPPPTLEPFITGTRIGISQGLVRVGAYGGSQRRGYGAQGADANLAARLMAQAAPGQILISPRVAHHICRDELLPRFDLEALPPVALKGVSEPLALFAVHGRRTHRALHPAEAAPPHAMVGRAPERASLQAQLQALMGGGSGCIIIEGEAGIGKSQLVAELMHQAEAVGVQALLGEGDAVERSVTYQAWRSIFARLLDCDAARAAADQRRAIETRFQHEPALRDRLPLLGAVLPFDWPDNELTAQLAGDVRADNVREVLTAVLAATTAGRPLVLILEDAHWLDSASWRLAVHLYRTVPNLLLVLAMRPPTYQDEVQHGEEYEQLLAAATAHLHLDALSRSEVAALICEMLSVERIPPRLLDFIHQQAEGHPLYSQEIVRALRDAELIRVEGARCYFFADSEAAEEWDFPTTMGGVINSRIDRLPAEQQFVLKVASVIGRTFAVDTLQAVHPIREDQPYIDSYLQALTRRDVTSPVPAAEPLSYLFKHVITQEVVYNRLLFDQRRRLHRAVAEWLERHHADGGTAYDALLAHHWSQAAGAELDDPLLLEKAVHYSARAGERAMRDGAYVEAVGFLGKVIALVDAWQTHHTPEGFAVEAEQVARWHRLLAEAHYGLGRPLESQRHFHHALTLLRRTMPMDARAQWSGILLHGLRQFWALFPIRLRQPSPGTQRRRLEAAIAYEGLAKVYYYENEIRPALYAILRGFNLAVRTDSPTVRARFHANVGLLYSALRLPKQLHTRWHRVENFSELDMAAQAHILLIAALWRIGWDSWSHVLEQVQRALVLFQQLRDRRQWGDCLEAMGFLHTCRGAFLPALDTYKALYELGADSNNIEHQTLGLFGQSRVLLRLGQIDAAEQTLREILAQMEAAPHSRLIEFSALGTLVMALVRQQRWDEATELFRRVQALQAQMSPLAVFAYEGYVTAAAASLALWAHAATQPKTTEVAWCRDAAHAAVTLLQRYARVHRMGQPRAWLYRGVLAWLQGKKSRAHRAWRHALDRAVTLEMPYEQALAHLAMGRHLPAPLPKRQEHLSQAVALFEQLGAQRDAARASALLHMNGETEKEWGSLQSAP